MFFTKEKAERYIHDLKQYIYIDQIPIKDFKFYQGNIPEAYKIDFNDQNWDIINVGERWGGRDVTAWFRKQILIPKEWLGEKIILDLIIGGNNENGLWGAESLIYINGRPVQGLDRNHREVYLKPEWLKKGKINIAIKAFSGLQKEKCIFKRANIVKISEETEDFYYRALAVLKTVKVLNEGSFDYENLLKFLNNAINKIDFRKPRSKEFYESIKEANSYLKTILTEYKPEKENKPIVNVVGHSHIDVAWLWRLKHTREKCSRTFSTVLHLMDQYPEYHFLQSTPQLYEFIKEDYPEIYAEIKKKVKEGKWEVTGGMWLEADCNVPSGESLVRQFLFGTRFMKKEFGINCKILWLPDVFGYSWALPQIIKKSGLKYFVTTKISWSQFNRPEYDTFNWRGLDGTEVLTHFITTPDAFGEPFYTYNGMMTPESVQGIWDNYRQKNINDELLLAYGWGDGGGGPTKEMLEMGKKMQELPGIPEVRFNKAEPFFERLEERIKDNPNLPVWDGELYLEYHRGTYTSQAQVKKNNRFSEILYHNVELFSFMASRFINEFDYPQEKINENWKIILRNQFHDILPGSSIHEVYEDSDKEFVKVMNSGEKMLNKALEILASNIDLSGEKLVVFNPLSWDRSGIVSLPWKEELSKKSFVTENGEKLFTKIVGNENKKLIIYVPEIPALGYKAFKIVENNNVDDNNWSSKEQVIVKKDRIENKYYRIKLNKNGQITSIYDKEVQREILPVGSVANVFQVFEDRPMRFDAWDIDIYHLEKEYIVNDLIEMEIEESGPDRGVIKFKWNFLDSTIEQRMIVYSDKRRIDFKTDVDWHQHQILLKVAFPVDIRTTKATYEIQFGNVERPTHWNTSWDYARFETVAQKWADLSERNYGVSLLNNCKYGYSIKDNIMRLTLIKSGIEPDPQADQGHHSFTYSLYPHFGDWFDGGTTKESYELNYPLLAVMIESKGGNLPIEKSLINIKANSVILDTVKKAEDDNSLILRFYEYGNQRDTVKIKLFDNIKEITECNLMEEEIGKIEFNENEFEFIIKPYEIKTFKLTPLN
ncbi:alpha-mannosidase [Marinitoga hydrogenitolerans DSM 16785]|uniref:Alpha-mannosidase n=1 Tax=Marinitoga hydrogenitolerans (strain DSM 16785 / JCM 12826 / AT1271) TaxID=1122195 RepID=A0A1M4ZMI3_MARH1|nr:alpha-mannosidase [Marinitoga hydrogenitolerans]SHF19135.1 alpha-mannosidase [Marinitoga hydrogenitolerans DSM 16785]